MDSNQNVIRNYLKKKTRNNYRNTMKNTGITFLAHQWVIKILPTLLLMLCGCSSLRHQNSDFYYDALTGEYVYSFVEQMPVYKDEKADFSIDFISLFNIDNFDVTERQTKLIIQFVIDAQGNLIGERIFNKNKDELSIFEKSALKVVSELQEWIPGKHNNQNVNVIVTYIIHIDYQ